MSPEGSNSSGLNTKPDFSSVPLQEPSPIKSPYAPVGGTLGDVADDISQNDTNHTIVMPSGLCQVGTLNNDKTLNISCKLIADSPKTINITYRNDFFDNYYIFIRESDGKYCEGNGYTTNNFKLYRPSDLQKDVTISFSNNTDFDSLLSDDIYFCNGT
jgi:hypothetical protein